MLYKVLWKDFPPEIATWEEESAIHDEFIDAYEDALDAEEDDDDDESDGESDEADEADAAEDATTEV